MANKLPWPENRPDPRSAPEPRKTATQVAAEIQKWKRKTEIPSPGKFYQDEKELDMQEMTETAFRKKYEGSFGISPSDPYGTAEDEAVTQYYKDRNRPQYSGGKPTWPPGPNEGDDSSTEDEFYGEAHMSNKFLPFVVENSTPTHMFKTLMSRSKGMNQVLIASIFHLILKVNIKTLRENVKELPDMPLEKVYEELLIKRPAYRVIDEVLADYQTIYKFFPAVTYWSDELKKYSAADAMLFFCSMAYAEKPIIDYTEYPYDLIKNREAQYEVLENIQEWVEFSDKGLLKSFANVTELRCFLLYHGLFRNIMEPDAELKPIKAVMTQIKL